MDFLSQQKIPTYLEECCLSWLSLPSLNREPNTTKYWQKKNESWANMSKWEPHQKLEQFGSSGTFFF